MACNIAKKSKTSTAPPRKISVHKFAESRSSELEALHSIVSNRLSNNFRTPRNKRRRTTAYDNQAAKKRHRKRRKVELLGKTNNNDDLDLEKVEKRIPRRVRRRIELKKNPEIGFTSSGDGTKRLRTHVWHAKRFTMTKLWGFHLPLGLHGRGRGSRAVLKWYKNGAVVHDASYCSAVQLEGTEESLLSILNMVLIPSPLVQSEDTAKSILSGVVYGTAMLHLVGAPASQLIAPVTYVWRPSHLHTRENGRNEHNLDGFCETESSESCSSHRQLWVWMHASAFEEGYNALKFACREKMSETGISINCFSLEGQLAKLEVMGSKAFQLLQKTLHPILCNSENSCQLKKCSVVEADPDPDLEFCKSPLLEHEDKISPCSVLPLTVKDPRSLHKKIAESLKSISTGVLSSVLEDEANAHVASAGISAKNECISLSSMSNHESSSDFSDNRNLWDASSRGTSPVEENVLCLEKHHARMDFICLDDKKVRMRKPSTEVQGSKSVPILLIKNNNGMHSLMGWSIILPLSWVRVFWVPFVSKGAHAIGLREKHWIACEAGLPQFPSDFPDCNAYSSFMVTKGAALDQKMEKLPPAVRPPRVPVQPPWDSICVTLAVLQDTQISAQKDKVNDNSLLISENEDCDKTFLAGHHDSFVGFVARTSCILTDFLSEIHADHVLLFPHIPNKKGLLEFLKDGSILGQGQTNVNRITSDRKLCFVRVLLHAYKEGFIEEGAVICSPGSSDISLWISRSENNEGGLQIPQSSVGSYFKEQFSGKWKLQIPQDPATRESHRWPVGFVTTGFTRGSNKLVAEAFCEAVLLARLREEQWNEMPVEQRRKEIYVLVRNLRSSAYRLVLATVVLEQQENDLEFL